MRLLALMLLAACTAAPELPELLPQPTARSLDQLVAAPSLRSLAAGLDVAPRTSGLARVVHGKTACKPRSGVNPLPVLPRKPPRVGELLAVTWSTRTGGAPPSAPCWLIASFVGEQRPIDFSAFGMPGCWLLVNPDQVLAVPTAAGGMVVRDGGHVLLRWIPPQSAAGMHFYLQLLVAAPGENTAGWLVAPAVEIIIGSA